MDRMEIDEEKNVETKESRFELKPVSPETTGEGLPYAPENWPKPGDVWKWRVGRRISVNGQFLDRYLYLPERLSYLEKNLATPSGCRKKRGFDSKLKIERFLKAYYPEVGVNEFLASFSWKIPAKASPTNGNLEEFILQPFGGTAENSDSDSQSDGVGCNAGNKKCNSLVVQEKKTSLPARPCDICCSESTFCHECCCILCCKTISLKYGGFNYIKCEKVVSKGYICGHVAHIECALRSYMAGTVGGSIGLDAEYYCRRCDAKSDLIPHVTKLLKTCESIVSREQIEKMLNLATCIVHKSEKSDAKVLLNRIESAISKLKFGISPEKIWKVEEGVSAISTEQVPSAVVDVTNQQNLLDNRTQTTGSLAMCSDYRAETLRLADEIDKTLYELQKSQAIEYKIAEECFLSKKEYIKNLYQQLEIERSEKAQCTSNAETDVLLKAVLKRVDQIKQEVSKLKDMEKVAKGFGRTPKTILKEHFGLAIEE